MKDFTSPMSVTTPGLLRAHDSFPVYYFGKLVSVKIREITYLEGEGNYTFIHTLAGKRHMVSKTLKVVQQIMDAGFVRIHKSYLVNPENVAGRLSHEIQLRDGKLFPISRRKCKEIHLALSDITFLGITSMSA
ncbi:MAG: LytR/AlgR family response regulator transcription factor [Dyadobacter fermentans]